jgi:acyl-CoA synthetase (AMP-forming)/AMP-acid ligase II
VPGVRDRKLWLKRIIWGTSSTPRHVLELLNATFEGVPVYAQFGQTETCGTTCILDAAYASSKLGSVGKPLTHVQMRIVDEGMRDAPRGDVGEIVYRGPCVLTEYWNNPEATASAFAGGWFHSGDLGRVDEDGFVHVAGRLKDMIISGGENISPLEVESAIATHPKVREVAVVGLPHPRWVESPAAAVVPVDAADPPTLEEIQAHLRPRPASFKKPTVLVVVDALPRNSTGKVVKAAVRDELTVRDGARR